MVPAIAEPMSARASANLTNVVIFIAVPFDEVPGLRGLGTEQCYTDGTAKLVNGRGLHHADFSSNCSIFAGDVRVPQRVLKPGL